ncbi:MAG: hypothetical protein ACR2J7_06695 [Luteimonas sp.]
MNKLIAIVSFALSLYGCDIGGNTIIHRSSADGSDVLYSKVVAKPGFARFECLTSASGQCFYTLYPRGCATAPTAAANPTDTQHEPCATKPVERFALASGQSRQIPALSPFRMCVSTEVDAAIPGCEPPKPLAAR